MTRVSGRDLISLAQWIPKSAVSLAMKQKMKKKIKKEKKKKGKKREKKKKETRAWRLARDCFTSLTNIQAYPLR